MEEMTLEQQQALALARARLRMKESEPPPAPKTALETFTSSLAPSALNYVKSIMQTFAHPVDSASAMFDAAAGGLRNITPAPLRKAIDAADPNPEAALRASTTASGVGDFYANRYGSLDAVKDTALTDPVGFAGDAATVLAGGAGLAKLGSTAARAAATKIPALAGAAAPLTATGNALETASRVVNPLTVPTKAVGGVIKHGLGLTTGVGAENVSQAVKAGRVRDQSFWENMTGARPVTEVLDEAKRGLSTMAAKRAAEYRANMASVIDDASQLKFVEIDKALDKAADVGSFKGQVTNTKAAGVVSEMRKAVESWKQLDPSQYHTPEGFDALKRQLGAMLEEIPYENRGARMAAGEVYNAAKRTIVKQAPTYAKAMKAYEEASDQIREIERTLSLGGKAAEDTAMRKLQSLARNNVQTNYGNRLRLAEALEKQGEVSLLPSISGQAMNSWTSRGLTGQLGTVGGALAGIGTLNPWFLGYVPAQSPRIVGLGAYGAGRMLEGADKLGLGNGRLGLLGYQLGQEREPKDW